VLFLNSFVIFKIKIMRLLFCGIALLLFFSFQSIAQFSLQLAGEIPAEKELSSVIIVDNYLLGVTDTEPYYFEVWDISNIQVPSLVKRVEQINDLQPNNMVRQGNTIFLDGSGSSARDVTLDVWNITDITNPTFVRSYASFTWNGGEKRISNIVEVSTNEMYAKIGTFDIARFNTQNPSNIFIIGGSGDAFSSSSISAMDNFQLINDNAGWFDRDDFNYAIVNGDGSMTRETTTRNNLTGELYDFEIFENGTTAFAVTWTSGPLYLVSVDLNGPNDIQELNLYDVGDSIAAGFTAILITDEAKNLVFVGGEISFVMVDVSNRLDPKIISKHNGSDNFLRRYGDYIVTDQFASGSETLIYKITDNSVQSDFSASTNSIFEGTSISFSDNSSGNPDSWSWSFPGGTPSSASERNPVINYATPGIYDVSLTTTKDVFSSTETKAGFIEVLANGTVVADFTYDKDVINEKESIFFQDNSFGDVVDYVWVFEGGTPATSNTKNPIVAYAIPGIYGVSLTVNSSSSTDTKEVLSLITVKDIKTCDGNITITNSNGSFEDGSGGENYDNNLNCSWRLTAGTNSKIRISLNNFETEQDVDILRIYDGINDGAPLINALSGSLVELDLESSGANLYLEFTANEETTFAGWSFSYEEILPLKAEFNATTTAVNKGESIQFKDNSTGEPISWSWSFPGGEPASATEKEPTVTYNSAGNFDVSLSVSDGEFTKNITKVSYVEVYNETLVAAFSSDLQEIEQNGVINYNNLSKGSPTSYLWVFEGGEPQTSRDENPIVVYPSTGVYSVKLTVNRGAGDTSAVINEYVTVRSTDENLVPIFDANTVTVFEGETISFRDLSTGNPDSWSWNFEGGSPSTSSSKNPSITYGNAGTYRVSLTAANENVERTVEKQAAINVLNSSGIEYADTVSSSFYSDALLAFDSFFGGQCGGQEVPELVDSINGISGNNTRYLSLPLGSYVILEFVDNEIVDAPNQDDLYIKECNPAGEFADVFVSNDKVTFTYLGTAYSSTEGTANLSFDLRDINYTKSVRAVKIVGKDFKGNSPGFDLVSVYGGAGANKAINGALDAKFVADKLTVETGQQIKFTDLSGGQPNSYNWRFDGGSPSSSNLASPSVSYQTGGTYDVSLTINKSGQQTTTTLTDYIAVYDPTSCGDTEVLSTSTGIINDGSGELNYGNNIDCSWLIASSSSKAIAIFLNDFDTEQGADVLRIHDGADATAPLIAELSGLKSDTTIVTSGNLAFINFITDNSITSAGWSINYEEAIIADFEVDFVEVIKGNSVRFTSTATGPIDEWSWSFEESSPTSSTNENPIITFDKLEGSMNVSLTVKNATMEHTLVKEGYITVLSPLLSTTKTSSVQLHPNPATKWVIIDNIDVQTVSILNLQGKLIKQYTTEQIDIESLDKGFYHVNIISKTGKIYIAKIIKQ
jgi:PKD repeat protein